MNGLHKQSVLIINNKVQNTLMDFPAFVKKESWSQLKREKRAFK